MERYINISNYIIVMVTYMVDKRKKILEGEVVTMGNGGGIYVPKEWIGRTARVQIIEDEEKDGE